MHFRPLTPDDAAEVLRINAAATPGVAALDLPELTRLLALSKLHLAAVRARGLLAGYLLAFGRDAEYDGEEFRAFRSGLKGTFVYVDQVAVDSRARGGGIGRSLYAQIGSRAQAAGARTLCCEVNLDPPNPGSSAFHRRLGFESLHEMNTRDGRRVELLIRGIDSAV